MHIVKFLFALLLLGVIFTLLFTTDNTTENAKRERIALEIRSAIENLS